ncbi:MAG: carboxypeptidase-like regulatory domain-containing protein [Flavobacteriaceae bacterium]|jgi:hypothetical protein|nr:carboxypeptidase-like regulatory domain-containing protein [Flavobacteriaceae bacterium]
MKTTIITTFLAVLSFMANTAFAQQTVIKGQIMDADDNSPVAFADVSLSKQDSTYVAGTSSDIEGIFEINGFPEEDYILSVSSKGYETFRLPITPSESNDTINIFLEQPAVTLNEVTIQARSVTVKDYRRVIIPTEEQVKMSTDGADVIRKMQLPRIMVDPVSGEISMSGNGELQLRINGVLVTNAEIASIPPADILRIEYHDDPGARYGNADAVIDYITRRKESGGSINGVFFNGGGHKRVSFDDRLSMKYNYGKSAFSANAMFIQRKGYWTREYDEKLIFPNHELHRTEVGEPTLFNKKVFSSNFNYSLTEKDKYFFNAQLRYIRNDFPNGYEDRKSKLYTSEPDVPLSISDHTVEKSNSPALDLYFQRNLKNDQMLLFNVVGTYIDTDSRRIYQEKQDNNLTTDILSNINGNKYSLITEGIYEKNIGQDKITGGIKHLQSYANNKYTGTAIADISMRQAESSVYAEYRGRAEKWGYMVNLTASRLYYSQNNHHTEEYALQPSARLTFEPNKNLYFRYRINLHNNAPFLSAMNDVEQAIDAWQIRRGNPNLDAFNTLSQSFMTGYSKGIFSMDITIDYDHEYNPVMESVIYEDGIFIRTYENQKSFQNLGAEATFKVKPWKNHLSLSVTPRVNRFISKGNNYMHTYTMPELRFNLDFSYNNWLVNFTTITPPRSVYGEQLMKSNQMYTIMAGYKQPNWSAMIGALNPFTNEYKTENKNWSALNPVDSKIHTNNNRSFLVKLSFNLDYGRQFKGKDKQLNNTDTDSGIMQGVKN